MSGNDELGDMIAEMDQLRSELAAAKAERDARDARVCHTCFYALKNEDECEHCNVIAKLTQDSEAWKKVIGLCWKTGMTSKHGKGMEDVIDYITELTALRASHAQEIEAAVGWAWCKSLDDWREWPEHKASILASVAEYIGQRDTPPAPGPAAKHKVWCHYDDCEEAHVPVVCTCERRKRQVNWGPHDSRLAPFTYKGEEESK